MRITSGENFATRPSKEMYEKKKYFLIYEGEITEPMYFDGVISNQSKLSISESISIISVLRSIEDAHNSHPKHVFALAKEIIDSNEDKIITSASLRKSIIDYVELNIIDNKEETISFVNDYFDNYSNDSIYVEELYSVVIDIFKIDMFSSLAEKVSEYLNKQMIVLDFNPKIDKINLIVDRDKSSFRDEQYDKLVSECRSKNINLYISNPSFEVWLLMHFEKFDNLDFEKLLENKRVNAKKNSRKYADKMLSDIIGYDKSNLKFSHFIDKIDDAIAREKNYCEDLDGLKNNVGSNVGTLIEEMRNL